MATIREQVIENLIKNKSELEVQKLETTRKLWEIETQINYINEKLSKYGKITSLTDLGKEPT